MMFLYNLGWHWHIFLCVKYHISFYYFYEHAYLSGQGMPDQNKSKRSKERSSKPQLRDSVFNRDHRASVAPGQSRFSHQAQQEQDAGNQLDHDENTKIKKSRKSTHHGTGHHHKNPLNVDTNAIDDQHHHHKAHHQHHHHHHHKILDTHGHIQATSHPKLLKTGEEKSTEEYGREKKKLPSGGHGHDLKDVHKTYEWKSDHFDSPSEISTLSTKVNQHQHHRHSKKKSKKHTTPTSTAPGSTIPEFLSESDQLRRKHSKKIHPESQKQDPADATDHEIDTHSRGKRPPGSSIMKIKHDHGRKHRHQLREPAPGTAEVDTMEATTQVHRHHRHHKKHGNFGSGDDILRVRGKHHAVFKFRKFGSEGKQHDPLAASNIHKAENFAAWRKGAHLGLPSNIGVPVENTQDLVEVGMKAMGKHKLDGYNAKAAYHRVYDDIGKKYSNQSSDGDERYNIVPLGRTSTHHRKKEAHGTTGLSELAHLHAQPPPKTIVNQIKDLRNLAEHLTEKRQLKSSLILHGIKADANAPQQKTFKEKMEIAVIKAHFLFRDITRYLSIWKEDLRMIHGKYGIGATIYFSWLRTIVGLNLIQGILVYTFVVFPEMGLTSKSETKQPQFLSCPDSVVKRKDCSLSPTLKVAKTFNFLDLLTGVNVMSDCCYLYYSEYRDVQADKFCPSHTIFETPSSLFEITAFRFAMMLLFIFVVNALFLSVQVKKYYHNTNESKIPGLDKKDHLRKLFCSWDFNVVDPKTAIILHQSIWRSFKDDLDKGKINLQAKSYVNAAKPELQQKIEKVFGERAPIIVHCLVSFLLLIAYILAGLAVYGTYYIRKLWKSLQNEPCSPNFSDVPDFLLMIPALMLTCLYFGTGNLCSFLAEYESWGSLVNKNFAMIARVGLFYIINIGVVYGTFFYQTEKLITTKHCYEDYFGQEMYRLMVLTGSFYIIISFILYTVYKIIRKKQNPEFLGPKFDPVNYTMRLFFMHTLACIGTFFCPPISIIVIIRLVITFYHHKRMLTNFYCLPTHIVQSSEINAPFLISYFIGFLTSTVLNIFVFVQLHPSTVCGPFSHYNEGRKVKLVHYYEVFIKGADSSTNIALNFLTSPGFLFVFVVFLTAFVYMLRVWGKSYLKTMKSLYHFVQLEKKDRDFLLEAIFHLVKKGTAKTFEPKKQEITVTSSSNNDLAESNWAETDMMQGIFKNRRGAMAVIQPLVSLRATRTSADPSAKRSIEAAEEEHGTVSKYLKDEFDWIPSQWHRRERRSAREVKITEDELVNIQQTFLAALQSRDENDDDDDGLPDIVVEKTRKHSLIRQTLLQNP